MGAENEDELEQQLITVLAFSEMSEAVLAADLAELAGPVSENSRKTVIDQIRGTGSARTIKAASDRPSAVEAVIAGGKKTEGALREGELLATAPDEFGSADKIMVYGAP